jgi:signal transduction histidine kinase
MLSSMGTSSASDPRHPSPVSSAGAAGGPSFDLLARLLATLGREAEALAATLWIETDGGLCLIAAEPAGLPLTEVAPHPGSEAEQAIREGAVRSVEVTPSQEGPPLLQDRIGAARIVVLPVPLGSGPVPAAVCLYRAAAEDPPVERLFAWHRWARLVSDLLPTGQGLPPLRPAMGPAQAPPGLEELSGGLARRVAERLAAVRPALRQAGLLLDPEVPAQRFLHYALEGLDRADDLLDRLAVYAGMRSIRLTLFDPTALAGETVRRLEDERPPQIRLTALVVPGTPRIAGDRELVSAAVDELVRNALVAAPGGTEVTLRVDPEEDGIRFEVRDEGVGMEREVLRRATEPFFSTRRPDRHAGLGLAFVHGVARAHDGRLVLSSGPGTGTTARLWLPPRPGEREES